MASSASYLAVIDMGTNTFHLLVAQPMGRSFQVVEQVKIGVRLGKGGINAGRIQDDALERGLEAIRQFRQITDRYGITPESVIATATSAVRNAANGAELVQRIREVGGFETRIISGLHEASLIYFGVKAALSLGQAPQLIMDIGGGSVEFILANDAEIFWKQSYEIGGQRLMELFMHHDPILPKEREALRAWLDEKLGTLVEAMAKYRPEALIGSSGTFDTLCEMYHQSLGEGDFALEKRTEYEIPLEAYQPLSQALQSRNKEERLTMPGMIPLRVDMIVVALCLLDWVLEKSGVQRFRVSTYALKEGVLQQFLETGQIGG